MKSARNGRWTRNDRIAVSSVGGCFSIVSCSASGSLLNAANVSAMFVNSSAWISATGAACADARPIWRKNWSSSVSGSARFCITGVRCVKSGFRARIASLIDSPRPANASPKPCVAARASVRMSGSNVERTSSSSSGSLVRPSGIVSPRASVASESPGFSSTYLSPSAERGRTLTVLSFDSGSTTLSSFIEISATERRSPPTSTVFGVISSTTPTRKPPTRTSLPFRSLAPEGSTALTS